MHELGGFPHAFSLHIGFYLSQLAGWAHELETLITAGPAHTAETLITANVHTAETLITQ